MPPRRTKSGHVRFCWGLEIAKALSPLPSRTVRNRQSGRKPHPEITVCRVVPIAAGPCVGGWASCHVESKHRIGATGSSLSHKTAANPISTPTRFRQMPDDSIAFVGVEAQKHLRGLERIALAHVIADALHRAGLHPLARRGLSDAECQRGNPLLSNCRRSATAAAVRGVGEASEHHLSGNEVTGLVPRKSLSEEWFGPIRSKVSEQEMKLVELGKS